jgi:hypothetical protein
MALELRQPPPQDSAEEQFRYALGNLAEFVTKLKPDCKDVGELIFAFQSLVEITEKLKSYCNGIDDLHEMVQLALTNGGQLRLLISEVTRPNPTRK